MVRVFAGSSLSQSLGITSLTNSGGAEAVYTYDKVGNIMYSDGETVLPSIYPLSLDFGTIYINNTTGAYKVTFYNHGFTNVTVTNA